MNHEQAGYKLKLNPYREFLSLTFICESISLFELLNFSHMLQFLWYTMILLIFVLRHAGLCGILGDESLRSPIFCHQLNKYSAYLYINHCHHHLSNEKYFYNTTKHFCLWVFSWGFKFWVIDVFRYHHCLYFLPKKKKKKKKRRHT